jgi:ligand-binding sensor domain-containing protein
MEKRITSDHPKILVLLIGLALWINPAVSQNKDLKFQRYSVLDGLSTGYIHSILQDQKGFMWFGTEMGLNRFDGYAFKTYLADPEDPNGLNNNRISTLFEDSKGRLWIGSSSIEGGLHIYNRDKDNFIRLLPDPEKPVDPGEIVIRAMAEDAGGNVWIATNNGIKMFTPDLETAGFKFSKLNANFPPGIPTGDILFIDSRKNMWIGTSQGLLLFDRRRFKINHYQYAGQDPYSLGDNRVQAIAEDHNGTIWIGTRDGGLNRLVWPDTGSFNAGSIKFIRYQNDPSDPSSISSNVVNNLIIDESGTLWIGTDEGINRLIKEEAIQGLEGTRPRCRCKFKSYQTNPLDNESLNYNFVRSIYFDASGIMWVGTSTGLNKQKSYKFTHFKQDISENSLASNKIQTIFEDDRGIIWIGSSKGLNQYSRRSNTFKYIFPGAILSISQDKEGMLWIGQWHKGLIKYDPATNRVANYMHDPNDPTSIGANHIFTTYVDSENNVWICAWDGGLNLYDRETNSFTRFTSSSRNDSSLNNDHVSTILEDSRGNLWVGTLTGLNLLKNKERGTFISYRHNPSDDSSLSDDFINCIYETREGTLWIGTMAGLNKMNLEDHSFINYTRADGLLNDAIMGILEDDHGDLWISTRDGVYKVFFSKIEELDRQRSSIGEVSIISSSALNDPNRLLLKRYNVDDGLQSKEFVARSVLKSRKGEMFFGGINGFNVFHPDSIRDNIHPPAVVFTNLQLFNRDVSLSEVFNGDTILRKSISETDEIILSHKNNVFSIEFAALNFVAPEQNQFAYMMEGFEDQWNFVGTERKAAYTNLNHGEYIFKVKAANNDGVWNEEETSMHIIITPPFWKTWWFKLISIAFVLAITFLFIELRLYAIKNQKKMLEFKVKSRTAQVVEQRDQIQEQAIRIKQMYEILKRHNIELEDNLHHLSEARVMQKLIGFDEFKEIYRDETSCYQFLEELKWKDGYTCKKCGSHEYHKDQDTLMRRCKKCNYKESITCGTIFHRLRFPIDKAFYILILTSTGREINISQLSDTISLRMKTCWEFHNKVKEIMQTRNRFKNPKEGWKELILFSTKKAKIRNLVTKG